MALSDTIGNFGLVLKVDVSNLSASLDWYQNKLGFIHQPQYDVSGVWAQLSIPEVPGTAVGLNVNAGGVGTGGGTTTFVVPDITLARDALVLKGVTVSAITSPGDGVQLAFFADPDGNALGLRQNPPSHPAMWEF